MSIKINITKEVKKEREKRKPKADTSNTVLIFTEYFFLILFLLEKISKIKSTYGKQDYQPCSKIKTKKRLKTVKKWLKIRQPALSGCLYVYIFTQLSHRIQTFWYQLSGRYQTYD